MTRTPIQVLLVEDDPGDAALLQEKLGEVPSVPLELTRAEHLEEALTAAGSRYFDVALLELSLPDSQGLDTVKRMHAACPDLPLVVLSDLQDEELAVEAVRQGAQDYLVKGPIDGQTLSRAVRHAIERKRLEDQLRQAQKLEAIGRLAGGVAHDFNNMLTTILGYADVLLGSVSLIDPVRDALQQIKIAAERAAALTHQLLAFSRKQLLQARLLDLNALVADMQPILKRVLAEDIELVLSLPPDLRPVRADPGQLRQVILNLCANGRDAMPGGGRLTLGTGNADLSDSQARQIGGLRAGPYTMLSVGDTGSGMDEQVKAHLFEPFFTTKEMGRGTGLGLAMVYGIVKQSGGHITVRSESGHGSTFTVYLPAITETVPSPERAEGSPPSSGTKETVLVVEDEPAVRQLIRIVLGQGGYNVMEASHGGEALQICEAYAGPIRLLITDLVMPAMSGRELVERLAVVRPGLRVLYISGYTEDVGLRRTLAEEKALLLPKPFAPSELLRIVQELLRQ